MSHPTLLIAPHGKYNSHKDGTRQRWATKTMHDSNITVPPSPDDPKPPAVDLSPPDLPRQIGRYRIERVLGEGGFGLVYLAHDDQLRRAVAVKVPHRRLVSRPEDAEAYLTEARTVANLDHPHIVPVFDVGSTEDYPCFIVSRFIEGSTLAQQIKDDRPTSGEAAEMVAMIADALHYAHRKGLVHRDIKPGNILINTSGEPFVVDFGLALREENIGLGPKYAGTPAYMSPEQARGEGHRVDGRSDIFSLGVVFYELLVGRQPFRADFQADLMEQITNFEPRPPRQYDDGIPKELDRICLKAMSKRASERYSTAEDMADDLRHFLNSPQREVTPTDLSPVALLAPTGNLSQQMGSGDQRATIARSTFFFADFKGFTERVRILEKAAGHQAAAEMKRTVAQYVEEAFRELAGELESADYQLIDTAGDGFFFHFRVAKDTFRFADALQRITTAHNAHVTDEIAEHWFRTGAATGDVAWDQGKPVGHVVNVGSRLQSASMGGDFVIDRATYDDLPPDIQQQFGPKEVIRDKHDKTYDVYRTAFGRELSPLPFSNPSNSTTPRFSTTPASDSRPIKIVPKGLRSFDAHDADFFLELLPGPRDRDGLPDSIRFWKTRIEEKDADDTFSVGLVYGPSGCGKSSLVKAGLLPRLSDDVIAIYVEATGEETETRLLNGLRKRCPVLSDDLSLKETVAALRRGQGIPVGKKVLIVLDQFEQWLHAKKEERSTELVQALRQCDGGRVQCVVMVRDDFWMAVTRFLTGLEIELLQGRNCAAADLFDSDHARKVLAAFGRAFGKLPENSGETSKDQKQFLEQAVSGLAQEGKVICVRLALFAEMMKGKPWTPATLNEVGGTEGVGVTFLEDTFSAPTANPKHRLHQKTARAVLKALLPASGTDIKGHMRSYGELLEASGYGSRPKDFDDLLRILDGEIRLITPTDPEGKDGAEESTVRVGAKFYQLTHDYLVPSLREWLTRKQKETRRGRAELLLADRAVVWNARPENRQLPSLVQWFQIRRLTAKKDWKPPQRKMMGKAGRYHAVRGMIFIALVALLGFAGYEGHGRVQAHALRGRLLDANTNEVPTIVADMGSYRRWIDPLLRDAAVQAEADKDAPKRLHASLALLPVDATQVEHLYGRLLDAEPHEVPVIRDFLAPHKDELLDRLWVVAETPDKGKESQRLRLRAAAALAKYDPESEKWTKVNALVVEDLVLENAVFLGQWSEAFRPVKGHLLDPLSVIFRDHRPERAAERSLATNLVADYAADDPKVLADLVMNADEKQFAIIFPLLEVRGEQGVPILIGEIDRKVPPDAKDEAKEKLAKRQANAAVALLRMKQPEKVWQVLKHSRDPRARSYLIHRSYPLGVDAGAIIKRLDDEQDVTIRRALLLSLGEFGELSAEARKAMLPKVQEMYRTATDPGLHAASEWLLRQWKQEAWLKQLNEAWAKDGEGRDKKLAGIKEGVRKDKEKTPPQWYVNTQGQTFVVIPGPVEFLMGSPKVEKDHDNDEVRHKRRIGRSFEIASKSVTLGEYRSLTKDKHEIGEKYTHTPDLPVVGINWYMAAKYCNLLSKEEGIDEEQWCYETDGKGAVTKLKEGYLTLTGYRLPTEAEMEYATRAGAVTSRYYGETEDLLGNYAWYQKNSNALVQRVGLKKPNDLGLFDMQGNCFTWCQETKDAYPKAEGEEAVEDKEVPKDELVVISTVSRALRGGSFDYRPSLVRSADRFNNVPTNRSLYIGFRPARTFAP